MGTYILTGLSITGVICWLIFIYRLIKRAVKKEDIKKLDLIPAFNIYDENSKAKRVASYVIWCSMLFGPLFLLLFNIFTTTTIGGFMERFKYSELYYANLFDDFADTKSYRVVAEIEKVEWDAPSYLVKALYFNDEQYIEFDSGDTQNIIYKTNKKYSLRDINGEDWAIELIPTKAKNIPIEDLT